jgi:PAS domain S-box-containing protein
MSEMAIIGAWEFTVETKKLLWTDQVYAIYGYQSADQMDLSTAINHYPGEAAATIQACFEACVQEGVAYDVILPFRDAAGRAKWIRTTGRPRKYKGKIISASGLFQDITKRHELELQMERTLARLSQYRNAVNSASIITIAYPNGEIRYVNKNFEQVSKYKGKELVGKPFFYLSQPFHPKEMWDQLVETVNKGQIWRGELLSKGKDESLYWTDTFAIPYVDQENKVTEFLIISNDISKRKIYEKQIHQSLKEKEVIIQELHHRVKNNLQMIASMASMESYYTEKSTQSHNLKRLSHRIRIMSGIHERLLHTDTIHAIEAKEYLEQVLTDLEAGYKLFSREIGFTYTIAPCFLSIDAATSLGLLFLEAFSILDDFFVDPTKGEVEISFAETSQQEYSLKFLSNLALDQGKVDIGQIRAGFSWEMLQTYMEQLDAKAEFFMHDTFCFTLQFKDKLLPTDAS